MKNAIAIQDLQTPQEIWFMGSTPGVEPLDENDWHIPQGVLEGVLSIGEAIEARKAIGHFQSTMLSTILGFNEFPISVGFSDIDKDTKMTLYDPKIIGLWDKQKKKVIEIPGRDLTREAYDIFQGKTDLHLRESKTAKEGGTSSSEQKA